MTFDEVLAQIIDLLKRQGRVSYGALKRRYDLDDAYLEDLKDEIIHAQQLAIDEDNRVLVWVGEQATASPPPPAPFTPEPSAPPTTEHEREPLTYTPRYLAEKILTSRSALEGERKQVTVLFADIKDSTELIRDLDPEDAQQLLDPAIHIMMNAVHRFEGTVNQVLGDGIMSIFGAPIAHEDHALRACYAALAMQAAMQPYADEVLRSRGIAMQIRVGLNSGEVVVRTIGNDLHMDYSAVGPTTHLAARTEQMAAPGTIRLTSATLKLVEGLVHVHALGPIPIRGMTDPVEVFELTGASTVKRRLQAAIARGLTTFVGRETEIAALNHALEQAGKGHGQIVAVVGEAGVGKSRLVYEFMHSPRTHGWLVLESASVSYGKATPYFPVVDLLKRYVHVEDSDDAHTMRAKVTGQIVTLDEALQETIPALLSLLDALPEDSPFLQLDPPQRRQRIFDALKRILLRESQVEPLLLVFEDLHWIDSETQALLDSLVESLPAAHLLLVVNYRPEYRHGWGSKTYYMQLRLDPLLPESADEFLETLLGDDPSLEPLKKFLIERTEGNPFFLEESVRTLVETQKLFGEPGAYRLGQELPTIQVPPTVQAVLAARMDRLPHAEKRLLQIAAVIGTEVPLTLLQAIAERSEEALYRGLTHLQAADFLYETRLFPDRVSTFKHALTHEVAYRSVLQERRRMLHARIVDALEALVGDRVAEQVERLAHHAYRGEVWDKALVYYQQAGDKAVACSAYAEAVHFLEHALAALSRLPESPDTLAQAIDVRLTLWYPLILLGQYQAPFTRLHEAARLAETLGDRVRQWEVCVELCALYRLAAADYQAAIAVGHQALALAADLGDRQREAEATYRLGQAYCTVGDFDRGLDFLERSVDAIAGESDLTSTEGERRAWLAFSFSFRGRFDEAIAQAEQAVRFAEANSRVWSRIQAHTILGSVYLAQGDVQRAIGCLEQSVGLAQTWNVRDWGIVAIRYLASAYALAGRSAASVSLAEEVLQKIRATGQTGDITETLYTLGEVYLYAGRLDAAYEQMQQALERARQLRDRVYEAESLHLLGEIHLHRAPPAIDFAMIQYRQALAMAEELGMRPLQAHCHRGLGTLYRQTGQSEQARAELSTAIDIYREMGMTFWLPETEAALAEVEGR
jgi:class 3 adenylate cyclase/tetratricopeptide (TPR) repeat protein